MQRRKYSQEFKREAVVNEKILNYFENNLSVRLVPLAASRVFNLKVRY